MVRNSLALSDVGLTFVSTGPPGFGPGSGAVKVFIGADGKVGAVTKARGRPGSSPNWSPRTAARCRTCSRKSANSYRNRTLHELVVKSLQGLGVMAVLSVGFGWAVAGRVSAPLHRMTATARKLSEENLHERIALDGPDDELKELADTFDAMLARLESAFDSQKRFVANASHELRTPLSIIRTEVDVALANPERHPERSCAGWVRWSAGRRSAPTP